MPVARGIIVWTAALAACALVWSATASAQLQAGALDPDDMAWFYNQLGADPQMAANDQAECVTFGARMFGSTRTQASPYGLTGEAMLAMISPGPTLAYADDCMMAKGYRRFDVAGAEQRVFQQRLQASGAEAQAAYVGAVTPPEGVLARQWVNTHWLSREGEPVASGEAPRFTPQAPSVEVANDWGGRFRAVRPLEEGGDIALSGDQALVLISLRSPTGAGARFERSDPATGGAGLVGTDRQGRWPYFDARVGDDETGVTPRLFVIPAGTYALAAAWTWRWANGTEFCMGTAVFRIEPGEVVDLGEFTFDRAPEVSELAPAPHVRFRIDQPAQDAARIALIPSSRLAQQMRQAEYMNAFPRQCRLFSRSYGFELPGAPQWQAIGSAPGG